MVVQHYAELLHLYRKRMLVVVASATLVVAVASVVKLLVDPVYTAAANVTVLPSQAELTFGRETSGGPGATARSLTSTYIEYLTSRPVVEVALERMRKAEGVPAGRPSGTSLFGRARGFARRIYKTIDSGKYVASDPRERALSRLIEAIDVAKVADSYILRIEVNLPDPESAAAVANTLAEAYVDRASNQLATAAGHMTGFLDQEIRLREADLERLSAKEEALKRELSISSVDSERDLLIKSRSAERESLVDAQIRLEAAQAELERVEAAKDPARSGRNLTDLNEDLATATASYQAASRSVELRQKNIARLSASLEKLNQKSEPLLVLQRQREVAVSALDELHSRKLTSELSQSLALTQLRVVDPALVPQYPSSPRVVRNTLLGFLVALLASLAGLVAIDSISTTVRTTADLDRLVQHRSLGSLRRSLVKGANDPSRRHDRRTVSGLEALAKDVERRLLISRSFQAETVQVSGMVSPADLRAAAVTLASALASRSSGGRFTVTAGPGEGTAIFGDQGDADDAATVDLRCQPPLAARTKLEEWARVSTAIVFVIPAAAVPEPIVTALLDRSNQAGFSAVSFLLLEP